MPCGRVKGWPRGDAAAQLRQDASYISHRPTTHRQNSASSSTIAVGAAVAAATMYKSFREAAGWRCADAAGGPTLQVQAQAQSDEESASEEGHMGWR
ncbi:Protein of unknown function [Gryllus bimaculatus]|nr:Protein of unknown function [Gryllus bimaculatus]